MTVSLTPQQRAAVARRVRSGHYGNASDIVRASLRALDREEAQEIWRKWQEAKAKLPQDLLTPAVEQDVVSSVKRARRSGRRRGRK